MQTVLSKDDAPLGIAAVLFAQSFGSALFVSIAWTIFTNRLSANLRHLPSDVSVSYVEGLGLTKIKNVLEGGILDAVIVAYSRSIQQTWYLTVSLPCISIVGSLMTDWVSVKDVDDKTEGETVPVTDSSQAEVVS